MLSCAQFFATPCMDCSRPGFPVLRHLPEFPQTHVRCVSDAIQPSHPLIRFFSCLKSVSASGSFPMSWLFTSEGSKYWSFSRSPSNEYLELTSFRIEWFDLLAVQEALKSLLQHQFESINSSALSLLYGPTLTSIHGYWKNHIFDYM